MPQGNWPEGKNLENLYLLEMTDSINLKFVLQAPVMNLKPQVI